MGTESVLVSFRVLSSKRATLLQIYFIDISLLASFLRSISPLPCVQVPTCSIEFGSCAVF